VADTPPEPGRAAVRASVVVPVHNGAATLPAALSALARQEGTQAYEVIVVDDGSVDDSAAIAERSPGPVTVVRQEQAGPAAARNRGAAAARGAVLCFTDADCYPDRGWLASGLAALEHAELVQGEVRPDPDARRTPYDRTLAVLRESGLYETANLFVRRELFEALEGFEVWLEPEVGKPLAEDVWFGWRARRAGARVAFCSEALVHHAVFAQRPLEVILDRASRARLPRAGGDRGGAAPARPRAAARQREPRRPRADRPRRSVAAGPRGSCGPRWRGALGSEADRALGGQPAPS